MEEDKASLLRIWSRFGDFQHVFLATTKDGQPRVRPVTLLYFDKRFWVTTDADSAKVRQVRENPKVEFSFVFSEKEMDCCLRVAGDAKIVTDRETKARIAKRCDFFSKHWDSVDDPRYALLEINPSEVTSVTPERITHITV